MPTRSRAGEAGDAKSMLSRSLLPDKNNPRKKKRYLRTAKDRKGTTSSTHHWAKKRKTPPRKGINPDRTVNWLIDMAPIQSMMRQPITPGTEIFLAMKANKRG